MCDLTTPTNTDAAAGNSGNVAARRPLPTLRPAGITKKRGAAKKLPAKKKVTETIKVSSSSSSSDDAPPGRFTCPARGCQETFASVQERITHARAHELDADQEHLAAYFYCTVPNSGCAYARNIHDDTRAGIVRKDQMGTHMRRARHHANMTDAERRAERALIVERTRFARINVGLPPITSDHEPLPAHGAALLPPDLP